jgi:hypothetical protein
MMFGAKGLMSQLWEYGTLNLQVLQTWQPDFNLVLTLKECNPSPAGLHTGAAGKS